MDTEDAGPSEAGSVSGYSELGSISSQLPASDTLGYAAMMLAEAELRLRGHRLAPSQPRGLEGSGGVGPEVRVEVQQPEEAGHLLGKKAQ